jgi:hypothetical protein
MASLRLCPNMRVALQHPFGNVAVFVGKKKSPGLLQGFWRAPDGLEFTASVRARADLFRALLSVSEPAWLALGSTSGAFRARPIERSAVPC